jgi:hypothetical protein
MAADHEKRLPFIDFYRISQSRCGIESPQLLVASWDPGIRELIELEIAAALEEMAFVGNEIDEFLYLEDGTERSNQSKGNVAADALAVALNEAHDGLRVLPLKGAGYPDRRLCVDDPPFACALEIKATSGWKDADGNRRVLTSSPDKIIGGVASGELPAPPCHLIATVLYDRATGVVESVRLDFLEPDSPVNVRLEASTSHKLLSSGAHHSITIR